MSSSSSSPFSPDTPIFTIREAALHWNISYYLARDWIEDMGLGKVVYGYKPRRCKRLSIAELDARPRAITPDLRQGRLTFEDRQRRAYAAQMDALYPDLV